MSRTAHEVLDQEFLVVRSKILEIAAFFDRLSEAEASEMNTRHFELLEKGCQILTDSDPEKSARLQLLFSRKYEPDWREKFSI